MKNQTVAIRGLFVLVSGSLAACVNHSPAVSPSTPDPVVDTKQPVNKDSGPVRFSRDIRPLLSDKCFHCHGPDEEDRQADLRLDTLEGLKTDLGGYFAVVPGKPEESEVWKRISAEDPDERMPPVDSHRVLSPEEQQLIRRWIVEGAQWEPHWAFVAPRSNELSPSAWEQWNHHPIDRYIANRLANEGLEPSEPADRRTLIRRLSLDLRGLPPTPAEIESFVQDESPQAYEKWVDRFLNSPHYGEHMARYWLDAARYGDTHGLHLDNKREMWPYRDWVISAFNQNIGYDRFVREQLAGDLLPNPSDEQLIASGFNRNHVTTAEGGAIAEEVYVRNVIDRTATASTVFMGLTAGCATCHDHKFDPLTQKEFYQLFAFFNNFAGDPFDYNRAAHEPFLRVATPEQEAKAKPVREEVLALKRQVDAYRSDPSTLQSYRDWENKSKNAKQKLGATAPPLPLLALDFQNPGGREINNSVDSSKHARIQGNVTWAKGRKGKGDSSVKLDADSYIDLPYIGNFERDEDFSISLWFQNRKKQSELPVFSRQDSYNVRTRGYAMSFSKGKLRFMFAHDGPDNMILVESRKQVLRRGKWQHIGLSYDGSGKASGVRLFVDGRALEMEVQKDGLTDTTYSIAPPRIGHQPRSEGARPIRLQDARVDDLLIYERSLSDDEMASLAGQDTLTPLLFESEDQRRAQDNARLFEHYLNEVDAKFSELQGKYLAKTRELESLESEFATTLVMKERPTPRPAYILKRGEYDQPGEAVHANTPAFLPTMGSKLPKNRLGLAEWLLDTKHPLTARVAVNRFWQQVFGVGLVRTAEDFGAQGEAPSHPDLLDWLAVEFQKSWDIKALMRLMVTSQAYRQSSKVSELKRQRDPENRLLSRGPRFRLDGEVLRDQALAVSGLLVPEVGGPAVKFPQPGGLWKVVAYPASDTAKFVADEGTPTYRRSLYAFWKRTSPPPQFTVFDAPRRDSCVVRRERTNTPLQALATLNEQQYLEAARALATRVLSEGFVGDADRLANLFYRATGRPAVQAELQPLSELLQVSRQHYRAHPKQARQYLSVGDRAVDGRLDLVELAAWTNLCSALLNLDEVVTKE